MSGPDTGGPPSGPKFDRVLAYFDGLFDALMTRLGTAIFRGDRVAQADANTSVADLHAAAYIREGVSPDALDRNGWPVRAS